MINKKFEAYKVSREIKRSGSEFVFYRNSTNEFGEPDVSVSPTEVGSLNGLYHEENTMVKSSLNSGQQASASIYRKRKEPCILCLYEDAEGLKLKVGDYITLNGKRLVVNTLVNVQEWNIIGDIKLMEVVANVVQA